MHSNNRKSGHGSDSTSSVDVRKAVSSQLHQQKQQKQQKHHHYHHHHAHHDDTRKTKSQSRGHRSSRATMSPSLSSARLGQTLKDRESDRDDEQGWYDEADSFPQFCMSCDKQVFSPDEMMPYCSEACRRSDQNSVANPYTSSGGGIGYYGGGSAASTSGHPFYATENPVPRDIVPRASPSRPTSTRLASDQSPPNMPPYTYHTSSALSMPVSLGVLLCRSFHGNSPSLPSPDTAGGDWPFSSAGTSQSTTTSSSSNSTSSRSGIFSTIHNGIQEYGGYSERPLPSQQPGGRYSGVRNI